MNKATKPILFTFVLAALLILTISLASASTYHYNGYNDYGRYNSYNNYGGYNGYNNYGGYNGYDNYRGYGIYSQPYNSYRYSRPTVTYRESIRESPYSYKRTTYSKTSYSGNYPPISNAATRYWANGPQYGSSYRTSYSYSNNNYDYPYSYRGYSQPYYGYRY